MAGPTQIVLLGNPVNHSISPQIHNAAFAATNLKYHYTSHNVDSEGFRVAMGRLRSGEWGGANVTIPHKALAATCMDMLTPEARQMGVVNTIERLADGTLKGHNTDGRGFLRSLPPSSSASTGGNAVIIGAGGAARAVGDTLVSSKMISHLEFRVRAPERVARETQHQVTSISSTWKTQSEAPISLLIQSTPLGLNARENTDDWRDSCSQFAQWLPDSLDGIVAVDLIYRPERTPFMAVAAERGADTVSGLGMLLYQGALAFEIWTGEDAPEDVMWNAARHALARSS